MTHDYEGAIGAARMELYRAKQLLAQELRGYPTPVSGCDLQYTHLLAEQSKVTAALGALGSAPFIPTPRTLSRDAGVESR